MKNSTLYSIFKTFFTIVLLISVAAACSNSASSEDDHDEDFDGFRLKMNGTTIVEQLPEQSLTGEIELAPGEETDLITVYFLNHDGDEFQPQDNEYSLGYEFDDEGIVEFEQHAEDGRWSFHLHAEAKGVTDMHIKVMHGGHDDFTSSGIHVHVEAAE
ncbi:MAG: hypothetical protein WD016_07385 [Balneolaceae bacterium]